MTDYSKITALYSRLSVGDEDRDGGESNSIQNQKIFLENYAVLKHYEGYIIKLSTRKLYDESGQVHYCIDETLRRRLETKLITKILAFEVA